MKAIEQLRSMLELKFGPEWQSFNFVGTQAGDGDAIVVDRADGQRIDKETLHELFALIPEVVDEYDEDVARYQQKYQTTSNSDED